jgi:hypothetical protein
VPYALGPCPPWCSGVHETDDEAPQDQCHESPPICLDAGPTLGVLETLDAMLVQYPNAVIETSKVYVIVNVGASDYQAAATEDLEALARGLEVHAQRLRQLARQLTDALKG